MQEMQCRPYEILTNLMGSSRADSLSEESCTDRNVQAVTTGWEMICKNTAFAWMLQFTKGSAAQPVG